MPSSAPSTLPLTRDDETTEVPDRLPVLPLRDVVVFPYSVISLLVGRTGSLAALEAAAEDQWILLVAQKNPDVQEPTSADLHRVGTVGRILRAIPRANETTQLLVEGFARVKVTRYTPAERHMRASITDLPLEDSGPPADIQALTHRAAAAFEEYVGLQRRIPDEVVSLVQDGGSPLRQAYAVAAHMLVRSAQRQRLLEAPTVHVMLRELSDLLAAETEVLRLEQKIERDVRGSLFRNQREFYLQEQLKAIHRELGEEDSDTTDDLATLIEKKQLPEQARARAERELRKLRRTPPLSPEHTVTRNYLDWLLALPWSERSDETLDLAHARRVLDEDHFGLEEVKERIIDFIATLALVGRLEGPILCLVGPPGVGKTSLGRSIARALGRPFARMSLGGVRDEAEIRGHRRTYIGAMPGRVLQGMRRAEVVNPVLLLDEVDKLGQDWRGDPAAALLEVLDPEQNSTFSDHYLEVEYDLSNVLFLTTANSLSNIPEALRDRMEVIRLPGYLDHEKHAIARRFLIPKQLRVHGIDPTLVTWEPGVVPGIHRRYTREAGVRDLERRLARIGRKLARKVAEQRAAPPAEGEPAHAPLTVREEDIELLLGVPPFDADESASREDRVGTATGLAYTAVGGDLLEIEVAVARGRGKLQLTGTLGDVLKESASAALTYARTRADVLGIDPGFHRSADLHVHIPAGATPKDGPSAGIAIAVALVSALTGTPVRGDTAMTGEVTLRGRVLPIGGLKEKAVAAARSGITDVIIPQGNARELEELPEDMRAQLRFHPVSNMDEVLALALRPGRTAAAAAAIADGSISADVPELTH